MAKRIVRRAVTALAICFATPVYGYDRYSPLPLDSCDPGDPPIASPAAAACVAVKHLGQQLERHKYRYEYFADESGGRWHVTILIAPPPLVMGGSFGVDVVTKSGKVAHVEYGR